MYAFMLCMHVHMFVYVHCKVDWLAKKMRDANFTVSAMHGDMKQQERDAIMEDFRAGDSYVVICVSLSPSLSLSLSPYVVCVCNNKRWDSRTLLSRVCCWFS